MYAAPIVFLHITPLCVVITAPVCVDNNNMAHIDIHYHSAVNFVWRCGWWPHLVQWSIEWHLIVGPSWWLVAYFRTVLIEPYSKMRRV